MKTLAWTRQVDAGTNPLNPNAPYPGGDTDGDTLSDADDSFTAIRQFFWLMEVISYVFVLF